MRKICYFLIISMLLCSLTGCWDAKEIQSINYATAIGVDYKDNQYVVYLQILDFNSVAKTEGAKPERSSVWVGKGVGLTANEAVFDIYKSSQQLVFWGNVTAIVSSERALKRGVNDILDLANRFREVRYTKWVFGTNEPLEHVLSITPFFFYSPLSSILHEPNDTYEQASFIEPIRMNTFIAQFNEPKTVLLPRLSTTEENWFESEKPHELLYIKGAYLLDDEPRINWLSDTDLSGVRWIKRSAIRNPVLIMSGDKPSATLIASKPKHSIDWELINGKLKFNMTIRVKATVNELLQNLSVSEIENKASEVIAKEIRNTYMKGLEFEADPLNLGYEVYKKKPSVWHTFWDKGEFPLNELSLNTIDVHVSLQNSGKYKLKK